MQEKPKAPKDKSMQIGTATIKDLAPEQKEKVGELIRRLAQEKTLREEFQNKYQQLKQKFDDLSQKYDRDVVKKQEQNRYIKLELKNSLRKLEQSTEHLKFRKSCSKLTPNQAVLPPKLPEAQSQPNLLNKHPVQREPVSPLKSTNRSGSKRKEIEELKKQIESLSKGLKSLPATQSTMADSSPSPIKKETFQKTPDNLDSQRLRQYQLIKSRYANNNNKTLLGDESFRAPTDQPDTPTLPEPMTFVKTEQQSTHILQVETSAFLDSSKQTKKPVCVDQYQTERVNQSRLSEDNSSIIQTVKKSNESRPAKNHNLSRAYRQGFYSSDLLDLVDMMDK